MPAENKPKIDLKARLGKKTVSGRAVGPSIPPPVGISRPLGSVPVPGAVPGIGSAPSQPPPRVDPAGPYSSITAAQAPVRAEPQAIKIELSEEVVQAQKRGRTKVLVLAGVTALIGGVLGFAVGGLNERNSRAQKALAGAETLAKEIDEANIQVQAMADVLKEMSKKIGEGQYPEEEVQKLGGIDVPFDGTNLAGKNVGMLKPVLLNQLLTYASGAGEADEQKDKIRRLLGGSREALSELLADKEKPKVRWAVYIENTQFGPWAAMQPVPEPFFVKDEKMKGPDGKEQPFAWPGEIKVKAGNETVSLKRYTKGDISSLSTPEFLPVAPQTQGAVCPSDVVIRLRREVIAMEEILRGNQTPGQERQGLIELGDQILNELRKVNTQS